MKVSGMSAAPEVQQAIELMNQNKISGFRLKLNKQKNPDQVVLDEGSYIPNGEIDVLEKMTSGFEEGAICWGVCKVDFVKRGTQTTVPHYYLLSWASDMASAYQKMAATCHKGCVRAILGDLIQQDIQLNSLEDLDINVLHRKSGTLAKSELDSVDGRKVCGKHGRYQKVIEAM